MREGVIIVHGARVPCRSNRSNDAWTSDLQSHLINSGRFHLISRYFWSGGFLRAYLKKTGKACAEHLLEVSKSCDRIHVVAKSHGAIVVESAIEFLQRKGERPRIGVLLRIATADTRSQIPLLNICKIIDVVSPDDHLYCAGIALTSVWQRRKVPGIHVEKLIARGFHHRDFNNDREIEVNEHFYPSTFGFYTSLLQLPIHQPMSDLKMDSTGSHPPT